tara:strand:- start:4155 stop:4337 length:183 start_codon:yes stop_codon:yes gene_type:complete
VLNRLKLKSFLQENRGFFMKALAILLLLNVGSYFLADSLDLQIKVVVPIVVANKRKESKK